MYKNFILFSSCCILGSALAFAISGQIVPLLVAILAAGILWNCTPVITKIIVQRQLEEATRRYGKRKH